MASGLHGGGGGAHRPAVLGVAVRGLRGGSAGGRFPGLADPGETRLRRGVAGLQFERGGEGGLRRVEAPPRERPVSVGDELPVPRIGRLRGLLGAEKTLGVPQPRLGGPVSGRQAKRLPPERHGLGVLLRGHGRLRPFDHLAESHVIGDLRARRHGLRRLESLAGAAQGRGGRGIAGPDLQGFLEGRDGLVVASFGEGGVAGGDMAPILLGELQFRIHRGGGLVPDLPGLLELLPRMVVLREEGEGVAEGRDGGVVAAGAHCELAALHGLPVAAERLRGGIRRRSAFGGRRRFCAGEEIRRIRVSRGHGQDFAAGPDRLAPPAPLIGLPCGSKPPFDARLPLGPRSLFRVAAAGLLEERPGLRSLGLKPHGLVEPALRVPVPALVHAAPAPFEDPDILGGPA